MIQISKRAKTKSKNKEEENKEKKVKICKSTFNTISNIILIAIICFN